jgi:Putative Flp pilus-assembly TadE/G-like
MIRRITNLTHRRRGTVAVLAGIMMIALLGMVAFAIDLGYLATSQAELQRTADASALAACYQLIYKGKPGTPVDLSTQVPNVPVVARQYAGLNHVCNSGPGLANSDMVVGFMADPNVPGGSIDSGANQNLFNAVKVTVRRNGDENGVVPSFFGKIFCVNGTNAYGTATAAFIANVGGFSVPKTTTGQGNIMMLPFALDLETWNGMLAGDNSVSTDSWDCLSSPGYVKGGADQVREVNLFPQGTGSPGNRGTVDIGAPNNSTADIVRQIIYGISPADMAYFPNSTLQLDPTSHHCSLQGDTGISAGFKAALASIIGQKRIIPIFDACSGNGNNCVYSICAFVAVEICDVQLTGSMVTKHLTVQPCSMTVYGATATTTTGTTTGYYIYSPIHLVQ